MKDPVQQTVENKRLRLRQIEAEYLRTKEYLSSPEWQTKRDKLLIELARLFVRDYNPVLKPNQDPMTAVFTCGRAHQMLVADCAETDVIIEHDSLETELKHYYERVG